MLNPEFWDLVVESSKEEGKYSTNVIEDFLLDWLIKKGKV